MLQQNWFYGNNFIMIYEYYNQQIFYDKNNECLYIVENDEEDNIHITELKPNTVSYKKCLTMIEGEN